MENKKVLGKIIPAVLVLVLALLLVIAISSCSKGKKTPTGEIIDEKDYLKINIADDKTYTVSKLEFYNKLRYVGYDVFEDALYEAALIDIVTDIKQDISSNESDLTNAKYFKKFKYIIDNEAYGTADEDEIEEIKDDEKEQKVKTYLNKLKQIGYTINYADGLYQPASFEYSTIKLAKREYARKLLLEEVDEIDSDNQITSKKIKEYFEKKVSKRGDLSALVVLFSSQTEITDTLKQLNLKFIGNKLYRVSPSKATYEDPSNPKFSEYEEYYDDFDSSVEGVAALDDNEVLFEFCRVYNYIYSYRNKLKFTIGTDPTDYLNREVNPLVDDYTDAEYMEIKNYALDNMVEMLLAQDNGVFDETPRLNYSYKVLRDIDTTLQEALADKYLYDSDEKPRYNTPSSTYIRGNYLAFKLQDQDIVEYDGIEALAKLLEAIEKGESETVIKAHLESIKEEFTDLLLGLGIYSDDTKIKAWANEYANKITVLGITGAKEIMASIKDKENEDSIFSKIFETLLTDSYINEKLNEFLEDQCKITIYDQLFEVQFASKNDFYKSGNKQSKSDVLKVVVKDKETKETKEAKITAAEMFDRLYKRHGAIEASFALGTQILKDKFYDKITEDKKKEFTEEYDKIISFFAQGNTTQYGYSPSIGQKAFVNLYFRADNKDDAIFNMWAASELQNILLYSNPNDIQDNMLNNLVTLTNVEFNNFVHIEYNSLYVYTDDDEDGKGDDWTIVDDSDPRKMEVKELATELINIINERAMAEYSNSNRDSAYNDLQKKYESASRISNLGNYGDGQPLPTFTTSAEKEAYYFSKFKAKGLFLGENISIVIADGKELAKLDYDENKVQLKNIYDFMLRNHSEDLKVDQIVARIVNADDEGANIDKATTDNIFLSEEGFTTFYIVDTKEAESFKFEFKDNADTSTGGKVYPYSIDENDMFPVDEDGKPIDNTTTDPEHTLYNTNKDVTLNQMTLYVREYNDGVESLAISVVDAFKVYFDDQIMSKYTSESFRFYIFNCLINNYISEGKLTINDDLKASINTLAESKNESLFGFEDTLTSEKWFELFN
jgi:hypothetical protein